MSRASALGCAQPKVFVALAGAILAVTISSTTAIAATPKTWDLVKESRAHRNENPIPDKNKVPETWSWMYGEADTPSSDLLLEHLHTPPEIKAVCGVRGFYEWNTGPGIAALPAVFYSIGPAVPRGGNACAPSAEYPRKAFFMHPDNGSSLAAVVRWKAPVTRTFAVSGSIQPMDSNVQGIVWQLDKGSTILAGPSEKTDDTLTSFGPITVAVSAGESLYLEMTKGIAGGSFDTTSVTLRIVG